MPASSTSRSLIRDAISNPAVKVVAEPFTVGPYGIGVTKDDGSAKQSRSGASRGGATVSANRAVRQSGPRGRRRVRILTVLFTVVIAAVIAVAVQRFTANGQLTAEKWKPFTLPYVQKSVWDGLPSTLQITLLSGVLALPLGVVSALLRLSHQPAIRWIATTHPRPAPSHGRRTTGRDLALHNGDGRRVTDRQLCPMVPDSPAHLPAEYVHQTSRRRPAGPTDEPAPESAHPPASTDPSAWWDRRQRSEARRFAVHNSAEGELTRRGDDTVAREYPTEIADELAGKPLDRAVLDVVVELAAGGPIADIGCGPGHVAAHLADRGAGVVGVDQSEAMCALASRATSCRPAWPT